VPRFPVDAPKAKVIRAFEALHFHIDREREHILMRRERIPGKSETLTLPNNPRIKAATLQNACRQAGIPKRNS
jgi:HicA toxin of bacterial toxin-antitoxin,